ncbi:MAG: thioredoxin family protein [Methanomicrobiales archaeon]|nr:thioredoxin family protein [Methanomicrobiales archaeon]
MPVRVVCFNQEGCMGCEEQAPINREVSSALGIEIKEIDVLKNREYIGKYGLHVTPTIVIFDGEKEVKRFERVVHREELEAAIREAGI